MSRKQKSDDDSPGIRYLTKDDSPGICYLTKDDFEVAFAGLRDLDPALASVPLVVKGKTMPPTVQAMQSRKLELPDMQPRVSFDCDISTTAGSVAGDYRENLVIVAGYPDAGYREYDGRYFAPPSARSQILTLQIDKYERIIGSAQIPLRGWATRPVSGWLTEYALEAHGPGGAIKVFPKPQEMLSAPEAIGAVARTLQKLAELYPSLTSYANKGTLKFLKEATRSAKKTKGFLKNPLLSVLCGRSKARSQIEDSRLELERIEERLRHLTRLWSGAPAKRSQALHQAVGPLSECFCALYGQPPKGAPDCELGETPFNRFSATFLNEIGCKTSRGHSFKPSSIQKYLYK